MVGGEKRRVDNYDWRRENEGEKRSEMKGRKWRKEGKD